MTSPLKAFRKYQRQMLVFFGVLLMIAFILTSVITTNFTGRVEPVEDVREVAVSWDGGHYDYDELQRFRNAHQMTQRFLFELYMQARQKGVDVRVDPNLMPAGGRSADNFYGELIIMLMADEAKKMGVVVGEVAVEDFLNEVGGNEFLEGDYNELVRQVSGGSFSYQQLKYQLQTELAALRMQDFLLSGIGAMRAGVNPQTGVLERQMRDPYVTPVAAVSAERMTNDTVKVQMVPVEVEPFLEQVKESPSRSEMRRLYSEAATKTADMQMQRAGFRQPDRARVQWFDLSIESLMSSVGRVTDAEIQADYDDRVARKDLSVVDSSPVIPPSTEAPLIPPTNPEGTTPEGTTPEGTTPEGTTPEGTTPEPAVPTETPTETPSETPAETPSETPSETPAETPAETPEAGDGTPPGDPPVDPPSDPPGQSNRLPVSRGDARFVSTTTQEDPAPAPPEPAGTQEPNTPEPAVEVPVVEVPTPQEPEVPAPTPTEPATQDPTVEVPATQEPATQEPTTQDPTTQEPATPGIELPGITIPTGEEPAAIPTRFKPLDDAMKTRIRDDIKRERARTKRDEIEKVLEERLNDYMLAVITHVSGVEAGVIPETEKAPAPPKFKDWSNEFGVIFGDTEKLYSAEQIQEIEIGQQAAMFDFSRMQQMTRFPTVVDELFGSGIETVNEYEPKKTLGSNYIYWIAEKNPSHVPTFEECQDEIVRYWRWSKAVELAKAEAQKKLDSVTGDQTLRDAFADLAIETQPFSYWSVGGGNVGSFGQVTISPVNYIKNGPDGTTTNETLDDLGLEFMDPVFAAAAGDKVIAVNFRFDTVYAVQVLERQTTGPLSETAVMNQMQPSPNATRIVGADISTFIEEWFQDLEKRRNVRWTIDQ